MAPGLLGVACHAGAHCSRAGGGSCLEGNHCLTSHPGGSCAAVMSAAVKELGLCCFE